MKTIDFALNKNKTLGRMLKYWESSDTWYKEDAPFSWHFDCKGDKEAEIKEAVSCLELLGFETGVIGTDVYVYYVKGADTKAVGINFGKDYDRLRDLTVKFIKRHMKRWFLMDGKTNLSNMLERIPEEVSKDTAIIMMWEYADNAIDFYDCEVCREYSVSSSWIHTLHGEMLCGKTYSSGGHLYRFSADRRVEKFIAQVCENSRNLLVYGRFVMRIEGYIVYVRMVEERVLVEAPDVEAVKVWDKIEKALGLDR